MKDGPHIAGIAALLGERARADMLTALMADRALTATELAGIAGITKSTASAHLAKLHEAGIVAVEAQGRHRYFRLAGADVAALLESLMGVAFRLGAVRLRSSPREPALRKARVCYDHLAGELAVSAYESLLAGQVLAMEPDGLVLTSPGRDWFGRLGIDVAAAERQKRALCRACLDWSERRQHLAGALGAALLSRLGELGWAQRCPDSRVVQFSPAGEREYRGLFGLSGRA